MKKIVLTFFVFIVFLVKSIIATTIHGKIIVIMNDGSNYVVKVQLNTNTGTEDLLVSIYYLLLRTDKIRSLHLTYPLPSRCSPSNEYIESNTFPLHNSLLTSIKIMSSAFA